MVAMVDGYGGEGGGKTSRLPRKGKFGGEETRGDFGLPLTSPHPTSMWHSSGSL